MNSDPLDDPAGVALDTVHAHFAIRGAAARRYPADVAPFGAVADAGNRDIAPLEPLLVAGEQVYLFGDEPRPTAGLTIGKPVATYQMIGPDPPPPIAADAEAMPPARLGAPDAEAMVALTTLAFPGFFRRRTHEMGAYYGVHVNGELVAMAGERLALPGLREVSGVCTHPMHTGRGHAQRLIRQLVRAHAAGGERSFLHVAQDNRRALELYRQLGFVIRRAIALWPIALRR
jgi:GNAT superfamily N-acetyltransferase